MTKERILVVDDDVTLRKAIAKFLSVRGYFIDSVKSPEEALAVSKSEKYALVITDLSFETLNGIDLISELRKSQPNLASIVITGHATIESAIEATRRGVFHYLTKPFNLDEMGALVEKALEHGKLKEENSRLQDELQKKYGFEHIVGVSDEMKYLFETIEKVADTDSTVLITGESGTGKELVARAIHYHSHRANQPLVPLNCAAIPSELLESELFGHVKGAFTGAVSNRQGRFEFANGGTIFLDEIGDMPLAIQAKVLRVIQGQCFEPVGSTRTIEVNTRIIAATNVDLEKAVRDRRFREDLYYRLNVIPISIPALRNRKSDIPLLVEHFLEKFNREKNRGITGVSEEAMNLLLSYSWPGNVRELENLVERIVILKGTGSVSPKDLPAKFFENMPTYLKQESNSIQKIDSEYKGYELPELGVDLKNLVDQFESEVMMQALERTGWNKNKASALLKMNRTTLVEKLKKKGLSPEQ